MYVSEGSCTASSALHCENTTAFIVKTLLNLIAG